MECGGFAASVTRSPFAGLSERTPVPERVDYSPGTLVNVIATLRRHHPRSCSIGVPVQTLSGRPIGVMSSLPNSTPMRDRIVA
jgi:hypothetical protein